jgi:hypothetical protein
MPSQNPDLHKLSVKAILAEASERLHAHLAGRCQLTDIQPLTTELSFLECTAQK